MKNKSVARSLIVGLGQLGLPVAKYVKEGGFETYRCKSKRFYLCMRHKQSYLTWWITRSVFLKD